MGRCLAFNFGPEELKENLKDVRYFVYSPDYDSAGYSGDQHFFAVIDVSERSGPTAADEVRKNMIHDLNLQTTETTRPGQEPLYNLSAHTRLQFTLIKKENQLFITLTSREDHGAVTDKQMDDVKLVDRHLIRSRLKAASFTRYQDVVFGEGHLSAAELVQPFLSPGSLHVPVQKNWYAGKSHAEAYSRYNASYKK